MEGEYDILTEAEVHMKHLFDEANKKENQCKTYEKLYFEQTRKIAELTEELENLEKQCDELKPETSELDKKESSSRDARKMYGDVTPGDTTHQDVILLYQNYFKNAFRNLPKDLKTESKEDKYKLWKKTADIFMASFEENEITIIDVLMTALRENSLLNPPPPGKTIDEKRADYYRAFQVFLKELLEKEQAQQDMKQGDSGMKTGIRQQLLKKCVSKKWDEKVADHYIEFLLDVLKQLDPEDYHSFIQEGKKHTKDAAVAIHRSTSVDASKARAQEKKIKSRCAACKRGFTNNYGDAPHPHMDLYWHHHHSYCARCKKLIDKNFHYFEDYDMVYCNSCLCTGCQQPLDDKALDIGRGLYHGHCLACIHCNHITKNMVTVAEGSFVCENCIQQSYK